MKEKWCRRVMQAQWTDLITGRSTRESWWNITWTNGDKPMDKPRQALGLMSAKEKKKELQFFFLFLSLRSAVWVRERKTKGRVVIVFSLLFSLFFTSFSSLWFQRRMLLPVIIHWRCVGLITHQEQAYLFQKKKKKRDEKEEVPDSNLNNYNNPS